VLRVELQTDEIPELFAQFKKVIDERYWLKRVSSIKAEFHSKPFLADFLNRKNSIAFALARCSDLDKQYGRIPLQEVENRNLYPAMSLAAQVLSIIDHSSKDEATKLIQRIRGAFKNPEDMRAIQLELMGATHFVQSGHTVIWPEMEGLGRFDILVKDIGANGLEVECKSISEDKGRKVHRREALEFHHLVKQGLQSLSRGLQSGISVVLTIPERLPAMHIQRQTLAKQVINAVLMSQNATLNDGSDIRISEFDISALKIIETHEGLAFSKEGVGKITATNNREVMILGNKKGAIVFVLQSRQDDTMLKYTFDTISESAKSQVTKTRPALFLVGLHGIEAENLLSVAKHDSDPTQQPTALRIATSKFLVKQNYDYVVGVGFLSAENLIPEQNGVVKSGGTAYMFPKRKSSFWHQDFNGLFSEKE
jgi:hypothetical protein